MRITLRRPSSKDRTEFLALVRASKRLHHPWMAPPSTPAQFDAYIKASAAREPLLICNRKDKAILGMFNLSQIFYGLFQSAYLSYWVGAPYAGKGYMSEGLELLLRHAFNKLKLHRIEANIQPANNASIALVKRAGFRLEGFSPRYLKINGRWRDHERWAITREDVHPARVEAHSVRAINLP